jgi:hypothetical protein
MPAAQRAIYNARTSSASNVKYNEDASIMTTQKTKEQCNDTKKTKE